MISDKTVFEDQRELRGWLAVLSGEWMGRDYRLFTGKTVVGSNPYAGVYLPADGIERFDFSIRVDPGGGWLTDLDSDSGLFVGGLQVFRQYIEDEMSFNISDTEFLIKLLKKPNQ